MIETSDTRRPITTRSHIWAHKLAHFLVCRGTTPNQMSLASIVFALLGVMTYYGTTLDYGSLRGSFLIASALFIQLRLLANMLDGLMAVEEEKKTATGVLYNEIPDRVSDVLLLVAAGYAAGWPVLGWISAILAIGTAYIRALGDSLVMKQDFCGPMAKQHRMFALTIGTLVSAYFQSTPILASTLLLVAAGTLYTIIRRIGHLASRLNQP